MKLYYRETGAGTYHALSDAVIPQGEWVHIVVTATADTNMIAYINGEAQTTNSSMSDTELIVDRFMEGYSAGDHETPGCITEIAYFANRKIGENTVRELYNDGKALDARDCSGASYLTHYWRNNGLAEWKDLKGSNDANVDSTETMLITAGADATRDSQGFLMNRQRTTNALNSPYSGVAGGDGGA